MTDDDLDPEFGAMARWTADAVAALGDDHAVPAGCRGSGSPAVLDWMADRLGLAAGATVVDIGAGVGGPAARLADQRGVRPLLIDPMAAACAAAARLFALPTAVAQAEALPLGDATAAHAWSLGVLCTTDDRPAALQELRRVLTADGRAALLVYVRTAAEHPAGAPEGNDFPTAAGLEAEIDGAGLRVVDRIAAADLPPPPATWQARADAVDEWIEATHRRAPAWQAARDDEDAVARLLERGDVRAEARIVTPTSEGPDAR